MNNLEKALYLVKLADRFENVFVGTEFEHIANVVAGGYKEVESTSLIYSFTSDDIKFLKEMYMYSFLIADEDFICGSSELENVFVNCFDGSMTADEAEDAIVQLEEKGII